MRRDSMNFQCYPLDWYSDWCGINTFNFIICCLLSSLFNSYIILLQILLLFLLLIMSLLLINGKSPISCLNKTFKLLIEGWDSKKELLHTKNLTQNLEWVSLLLFNADYCDELCCSWMLIVSPHPQLNYQM